jgi:hypothetical protein
MLNRGLIGLVSLLMLGASLEALPRVDKVWRYRALVLLRIDSIREMSKPEHNEALDRSTYVSSTLCVGTANSKVVQ